MGGLRAGSMVADTECQSNEIECHVSDATGAAMSPGPTIGLTERDGRDGIHSLVQ
jgi:hypothetical protein